MPKKPDNSIAKIEYISIIIRQVESATVVIFMFFLMSIALRCTPPTQENIKNVPIITSNNTTEEEFWNMLWIIDPEVSEIAYKSKLEETEISLSTREVRIKKFRKMLEQNERAKKIANKKRAERMKTTEGNLINDYFIGSENELDCVCDILKKIGVSPVVQFIEKNDITDKSNFDDALFDVAAYEYAEQIYKARGEKDDECILVIVPNYYLFSSPYPAYVVYSVYDYRSDNIKKKITDEDMQNFKIKFKEKSSQPLDYTAYGAIAESILDIFCDEASQN